MKKILVVGINGFVGRHLAVRLQEKGYSVIGCGMDSELSPELQAYAAQYCKADLTNIDDVNNLPLDIIDGVINLAGLAQVGASFGNEELYMRVNVDVHKNIVNRLKEINRVIRVIAISTGAVYDNSQPMPLTEDSRLALTNTSPYALSKIAMEKALLADIQEGQDIIIARPFNHIGPGQLPGFIVPDLAQQLLSDNKVLVGNLSSRRDYTDVRDVVRAYVDLLEIEKPQFTIYNVCSARSLSGEEILHELIKAFGKQESDVQIEVDQSKIRPNDYANIIGDNARLRSETTWQPEVSLENTMKDFVSWLKSQKS